MAAKKKTRPSSITIYGKQNDRLSDVTAKEHRDLAEVNGQYASYYLKSAKDEFQPDGKPSDCASRMRLAGTALAYVGATRAELRYADKPDLEKAQTLVLKRIEKDAKKVIEGCLCRKAR